MEGVTGGEELVGALDFVAGLDAGGWEFFDEDGDVEAVVEACGSLELGGAGEDGEEIALFFEFAVRQAELVEEVDAGGFEPSEVVGVMDDAHVVGFDVSNANFLRGGKHGR